MKLQFKSNGFRGYWSYYLSIYRMWNGTRNWTDRPTYRYIGINRRSPWALGWSVDYAGRLYCYLGPITLMQDIKPLRRRGIVRKETP